MEQISPQFTKEMPEEFRRVREKLLREFPKENVEGLNLQRAEKFIKDKGLEVKPYIIVGKNDFSKMRMIVGESLWKSFSAFIERGGLGLYDDDMDLVAVYRDEGCERVNGEIFTERFLVHELSHASSEIGYYALTHDRAECEKGLPRMLRIGFCLRSGRREASWGVLIEEGWAEMQGADYSARYAAGEDKDQIESALGLGHLEMEDTIPTSTAWDAVLVNVSFGNSLPLPLKYILLDAEGRPCATTAAFAGHALELLCQKNPPLAPAMIEARKSVEGLRKFARVLHETSPELYKKLQVGYYSAREFRKKLEMVIDKIGGGIENVIKARGPLREKWDKILKKNRKG
jgi:hypothetical protein